MGGLVIRDARAGELGPATAATKNVSNQVNGLGLAADPDAVSAATTDRTGSGTSRDSSRQALTGIATGGPSSGPSAVEAATAKALADRKAEAAAARTAATKAKTAKANALAAAHRWVSPLASYTLTSGYGWRWGKVHPAQDLATPVGSRVHSLSSGTVVFAGWDSTGFGNLVRIQYWDGTVSFMAHNSRLAVSVGEKVAPGQLVAYSGNTGHSTGPHVHLEIHPGGDAAVPPMPWLARHGIRL